MCIGKKRLGYFFDSILRSFSMFRRTKAWRDLALHGYVCGSLGFYNGVNDARGGHNPGPPVEVQGSKCALHSFKKMRGEEKWRRPNRRGENRFKVHARDKVPILTIHPVKRYGFLLGPHHEALCCLELSKWYAEMRVSFVEFQRGNIPSGSDNFSFWANVSQNCAASRVCGSPWGGTFLCPGTLNKYHRNNHHGN